MGNITLHIGMHKTGSSSIQLALAGFDDGNTTCPDLGYENHSIPFYTAYSENHQKYHIWKRAGLDTAAIEEIKAQCLTSITQSLKLCEQRNLIYSGEAISLLDINSIGEIKETLKKHTNEIKVICYFRDPESHAQSAWQETIKNGVNASSPQQPNYREKLEKFIHVFGEKNIVLKHFSKDKLFENDVVSDFFKTCGISQKKNTPRQNNALSTEAIKCIYILNKIISPLDGDKHSNIARDHFIETVTTLFPGKFHVPAGMLSEAINEEDCKWMEQISGTKLLRATEYLNTTNCQDPNQYFSELLPQTIDSMLNHLNINVDLNRDSAKIVNRLYLECFSKIMPKTIEFSADRYLERNPDVKNAGVNPYEHYLTFGCREGRLLK